jgi:hypothetical protein
MMSTIQAPSPVFFEDLVIRAAGHMGALNKNESHKIISTQGWIKSSESWTCRTCSGRLTQDTCYSHYNDNNKCYLEAMKNNVRNEPKSMYTQDTVYNQKKHKAMSRSAERISNASFTEKDRKKGEQARRRRRTGKDNYDSLQAREISTGIRQPASSLTLGDKCFFHEFRTCPQCNGTAKQYF